MRKSLEIHMATFNGEEFLPASLDSLLDQTDGDFVLKIRDDGSKDSTLDILELYRPRFGERMHILRDRDPSGSAKANFSRILENCESDFVLWADQDDVWLPEKVSLQRQLLEDAEREFGQDCPIYVYTDAIPVDGNLSPIQDSYFAYKKINPGTISNLRECLVCGSMIGCASGLNRALCRLISPIPADEVAGHDWFAFQIAASCGRIAFSSEPSLLYRLHGSNVSQQQINSLKSYVGTGNKTDRVRRGMRARWKQARAVLDRLPANAPLASRKALQEFVEIEGMSPLARRAALVRRGFLYPDFNRNLAMLSLC